MTGFDGPRISALMGKELADLRAAKGVLVGPLAMLAMAVAMPVGFAVVVPAWSGERLEARDQALLLQQFLPLLALVPVVGAMALVTTSIVGEKQAHTLEPLLATPLTTAELLVAKTGTAFGVALVSLAGGYVLLVGLVAATALPGVTATLASATTLALVAGVAPAATLVALTLGAIVSARAKDARSAQQAGVVVVLPIVGGFLAQLSGAVDLSPAALVLFAGALLVVAGLLGVIAVHVFDRERILTQWT